MRPNAHPPVRSPTLVRVFRPSRPGLTPLAGAYELLLPLVRRSLSRARPATPPSALAQAAAPGEGTTSAARGICA